MSEVYESVLFLFLFSIYIILFKQTALGKIYFFSESDENI